MSRTILDVWGANLTERRLQLGLSQQLVAKKVGVSAASLCRWEKGVTGPTDTHKMALAKVLAMDARYLFPLVAA